MSDNPIVYWELASSNAEKSAEFFKKALAGILNTTRQQQSTNYQKK